MNIKPGRQRFYFPESDQSTVAIQIVLIGHAQYTNIPTLMRGFRVKIANISGFSCLSIPKRDFDTKKTTPIIEVCLESRRAMLEY